MRIVASILLVIGSVLSWLILIAIRGDYIANVLYPGEGLGEPIWVYDPGFFILVSFIFGFLTLFGLLIIAIELERTYYVRRKRTEVSSLERLILNGD